MNELEEMKVKAFDMSMVLAKMQRGLEQYIKDYNDHIAKIQKLEVANVERE